MMTTGFKVFAVLVSGVLLVVAPTLLRAEGEPEAGREKAQTCEACHGLDGKSVEPTYPNLAGQHQSYLIKALADYRSGARANAIMAGFAASLSNQDIEDLAAWYASQEGLEDLHIE
jgi:cytochrome c553